MGTTNKPVYREINIGRVTGLSTYELAVKNGMFSGTEEEYVKKEQKVYDDVLELKNSIDTSLSDIRSTMKNIGYRMNFLGYIDESKIIDTIFSTYRSADYVLKDRNGGFAYTFTTSDGMIMGTESDATHGVQMKLSWKQGLDIRTKDDSATWSDWNSSIFQPVIKDEDVSDSEEEEV